MKRCAWILVALTACSAMLVSPLFSADAPTAPPAASQAAKALTADQVKAAIARLADKDFKVRAAAQKELVQGGPAVLDALEQATKNDDAEVRQRAADAIKEIKAAVAAATSLELAKNFLWSYPMENGANSSPVVVGGMAYVTGQDGKLHAVDSKTGKVIWMVALPTRGASQVSADEKVVIVTQMQSVTAFDTKEGKQLWQKEIKAAGAVFGGKGPASGPVMNPPIRAVPLNGGGAAGGGAGANLAPGGAPVVNQQGAAGGAVARPGVIVAAGPFQLTRAQSWVVGELVVTRLGDKLKACKALTGDDAWEMDVKAAGSYCNSVLADGVLYLVTEKSVAAIDLASHKELWNVELPSCSSLAMGGKTLCCLAAGKIVALDAKKGDKLWDADVPAGAAAGGNIAPVGMSGAMGYRNLVVDDARVYVVIGEELTTFDLKKGEKATAKLDLSVPQAEGAKDPATGGPDGGMTVVIQGGAAGFKTMPMNSGMVRWTAAGGTLYGANNLAIFAFDGKTGQRLWALPISLMLTAEPTVADGVIYFATMKRYAAQPVEDPQPKDLPGMHALKMPKGK